MKGTTRGRCTRIAAHWVAVEHKARALFTVRHQGLRCRARRLEPRFQRAGGAARRQSVGGH